MIDVSVEGADKLAKLAKLLRETGDKELRRELTRGLQRATKPIKAAVTDAVLEQMPHGGGLNRRLARSKVSSKTSTGRDPRVRLLWKGHRDLDRGKVRHPVFGNRDRWVDQQVPAGVFSDTVARRAPAARDEIERAVDAVTTEAQSRIGRL